MTKGIAERRLKQAKYKKRTMEIAQRLFSGAANSNELCENYARRNTNNRKYCSCHMCGNPRRIWGQKTKQELSHPLILESDAA